MRPATSASFVLGEGPMWDAPRACVRWVDIQGRRVLRGELDGDAIRETSRVEANGRPGALAMAADGRCLVAIEDRLEVWNEDGTVDLGPVLLTAGSRFNDGAVDPAGRFVVGSAPDGPGRAHNERLFQIGADGVRLLDDDLSLSNGIAWNHTGNRMVVADSLRKRIWIRDYDVATGEVGPREPFVDGFEGEPDGVAMDAEDHLWVAVWGEGAIHRYDPYGAKVQVLSVPAPHTTSVAFVGPKLDRLMITTATAGLDAEGQRAWPQSGKVFLREMSVAGLPVPMWSGHLPEPTPPTRLAENE